MQLKQASALTDMIDVTRPAVSQNRGHQLRRVIEEGCSLGELVRRYLTTATGPGRLSFIDFMKLRLFEPRFADRASLRQFVGERRALDLCVEANYRIDWFGMLTDKVAERSYLSAFGLPTIDFQAIYVPGYSHGATMLGSAEDLERFLTHDARYPVFGKPVEGYQSLGSAGLLSYDPATRQFMTFDGTPLALDDLVATIVANYAGGYVFQPFEAPNTAIAALCGDRLSTVRFLTLQTPEGPVIARTAMKIPGGSNVADNFWRKGNLLAQIDKDTGRLGRVISGSGLDMIEVARHPQTDHPFGGWAHPDWEAMRALALAGAHIMRNVPIIGWDIANTASGPTIVEMNPTPDMLLFQLVEGQGMLDDRFDAFLAYQAKRGGTHRQFLKAELRKI